MALPPPTSPRFLKVGPELIRLTCLSRVYPWFAHFDPTLRLPFRCSGESCLYCGAGRKQELRFVVGCFSERTGRVLFEMRERHRPIAAEMDDSATCGVGHVLLVSRSGSAQNSPIQVEIGGWKEVEEWDIARLVDSLGNPALSQASPPKSGQHESAKTPIQIS